MQPGISDSHMQSGRRVTHVVVVRHLEIRVRTNVALDTISF